MKVSDVSDLDQTLLRRAYREAATTSILMMSQFQRELPVLIKKPRQMALLMGKNNSWFHSITAMYDQLHKGQEDSGKK